MDYEKKYNEALELAKSYYGQGCNEFLDTIFTELRESEDERIRKEINTLYSEIDTCISELLEARTDKDSEAEGKALFKMEGLMVATLQDLSCIEDHLEKQKDHFRDDTKKVEKQDYSGPRDIKDAFIAGAKWQKEQIMSNAVEGTVYGNGVYTWVAGDIPSQFKYGDKVRIIIVKE
jgi:hypothetical protein